MQEQMNEFVPAEDDRVRIDIPDESDPDHRLHGEHGHVVEVLQDDASVETGDDLREASLPSLERAIDEPVGSTGDFRRASSIQGR